MVLKDNNLSPIVVHHWRYSVLCPDAWGEPVNIGDDQAFLSKMMLLKDPDFANDDLDFGYNRRGSMCEWCMQAVYDVIRAEHTKALAELEPVNVH